MGTQTVSRSEAAMNGWDNPEIRAKRESRVRVEVRESDAEGWEDFRSVPFAFRHLGLTQGHPLKDATAKAVRLIIAQGGRVCIHRYEFRKKGKSNV